MKTVKSFIKAFIPDRISGFITGLFYGWHGNYSTWEIAEKESSGYNNPVILKKVAESTRKILSGNVVYERDSVLFDKTEYSFPLLAGLLWVAASKKSRLNVLDFGGSLGTTYYQNRWFLDSVEEINWCIVEQPDVVEEGRKNFSSETIRFFYSIEECCREYEIDVILLSSVLQYIKEPYKLLDQLISRNFEYILVDRTPFIEKDDRITIQKVHPSIYKATYPCWFFNRSKFIRYFTGSYELVLEFDALDKANIPSEFKGFIFKKRRI